ncbi:MAG: hypothetical protein ABRQ37_11770 [Candidatus Eremiobacterota bacterium]
MSVYDTLKVMNKIASDKSTNNLLTGKVSRERDNDIYDAIIMGDKTIEMPSLKPVNTNEKYKKDDSIFIGVPYGEEGLLRILSKSNIEIPDEKEHRFRSKIITPSGTIYLCCPGEGEYGLIKVYSLNGTPGTSISLEINAIYNICTDGTYLYCSGPAAYVAFKIKTDGTECQQIVFQARYYNAYGLAINSAGTHLYIAYAIYGSPYGIAKINISTGDVEETEITSISFDEIADLCGDGTYLYLLGRSMCGTSRIAVYDFNLNFIREISTDGIYNKIAADGTNLYLYNSYSSGEGTFVKIYSTDGTLLTSISCYNAKAVAAKEGKFYVVDGGNKKI